MFYYHSAFGKLQLPYNNDFPLYDPIHVLLYVPIIFEGLEKCLNIDISYYIDKTCEKYGIMISDYSRELILSYFSRKKDVIDRTLTMTLKHK